MDAPDLSQFSTVQLVPRGAVEVLEITRQQCRASLSLFGGQLLSYQPEGQQPVLWESEEPDYSAKTAIRGGIPLCWPWFNALSQNHASVQQNFPGSARPSHGLVRTRPWQLLQVEETETVTRIQLQVIVEEAALALNVSYEFGASLKLDCSSRNLSDQPQAIAFALHSYFAVSDIAEVQVNGLDRLEYIDHLDDFQRHKQQGPIWVDGEIDRFYLNTPGLIELLDRGWQRTLQLQVENSHSAVVWNPWVEKGSQLSQFDADDYRHMLCVETARAGDDFLILDPFEVATTQLLIEVQGA